MSCPTRRRRGDDCGDDGVLRPSPLRIRRRARGATQTSIAQGRPSPHVRRLDGLIGWDAVLLPPSSEERKLNDGIMCHPEERRRRINLWRTKMDY